MTFEDNRQYIETLEKSGDAVRINEEVDWDLEVGAISRLSRELAAPSPFFQNIKDYPGMRMFGVPFVQHRRLAIALGMPPDSHPRALQQEYERRSRHPLKPILVSNGPCKENKLFGKDVDLCRFPVPIIHEGDGGRYIGSWHIVINKDPDSDWTNWGMYRTMLQDRRHVSIHLHAGNDGGRIFQRKYKAVGKPMPVAIAIGIDPCSAIVSSIRFEAGISEAEYAGSLLGKPVQLVKCETNDLLVPATSEIVLEGVVYPNAIAPEGPFGEYTGYRTNWEWKEICRIDAVTWRNNPILTFGNPGVPGKGGPESPVSAWEILLKKALMERAIPVTDVFIPAETVGFLIIIGVKRTRQGNMATKVRNVVRSQGIRCEKIIVVDEDVDVFDMSSVLLSFATRCHPGRSVHIDTHDTSSSLTPYLTARERNFQIGASMLMDCTWPVEWSPEHDIPPIVTFEQTYSEDIRDKVKAKWHKYGFK